MENRIAIDERIQHGKPVIKGTRVPVHVILGALGGGMTYEEVCTEFGITKADIAAAINYAQEIVSQETVRPLKAVKA